VVAVSGGVDSVTLAVLTLQQLPGASVFHAVSPAVPPEATRRVRRIAAERGWELTVIDAGEFDDPEYRANPPNRCFHCKTHLYGAIRARTARQILSGANLDDLKEYRPGLDAARRHGVRHPFIEASMDKPAVRALARRLELHGVADLPASPCLSSRVETGIRIETEALGFIHAVEQAVAARLNPATVRCRIRAQALVVELDAAALSALSAEEAHRLERLITGRPDRPGNLPVLFREYRNGGAFLRAGGR
jgi:uncharacterized protein